MKKWIYRNWLRILVSILIIILTYPKLKDYCAIYSYQEDVMFTDSVSRLVSRASARIKIDYSTPKAMLPYEPITAKVKLRIYDKSILNTVRSKSVSFRVNDAHPDDKRNVTGTFNEEWELTENPFSINLKYNMNEDFYTGEGKFYVAKPGDTYAFLDLSGVMPPLSCSKLTIGSDIEMMNKRTNDLLFVITVITFAFLLYAELVKKRQN